MSGVLQRIVSWISYEPTVGLLMVVSAIVLFGSTFGRVKRTSQAFWPWLRHLLEASVASLIGATLFIGLLWAFRTILNDNINTFFSTHGSRSDISYASAQTIWGRPHEQIELTVMHSHEVEVQEEIPREDPNEPPTFRTVMERQIVPQNSIIGFGGTVDMQLSERLKGYALYSGFVVDVALEYTVINDSEFATDAEFDFPLSPGQTLFEDFTIEMDGRDMSSNLRFRSNLVSWTSKMRPHQRSTVVILYRSRGMDYFFYKIPVQREIKDFELELTIDRLPVSLLNYPDGVITPTAIRSTEDGRGSILTWKLDRAITVAGMGVSLVPPEQPGAKVLRVLVISPYALTLLGAMLALTMLIWGIPVRFLDLALLSAVYSMQFLVMAAISDTFFGFWGSLIVGAALTLVLSYLLFRRLPSRPLRISIYGLVAFFTVIYPLTGLLSDLTQLNSFDTLVQVGMILYITGSSLFVTGLTQRKNPQLRLPVKTK